MKKVCILFGGASSEHEVSLRSATSVLENIDHSIFDVIMLGITKDGAWLHYTGDISLIISGAWQTSGHTCPAVISPDRGHHGILLLDTLAPKIIPVDVCFPVLHGKYGEDGTVQGLLELAGIPCVGSGVLGSSVCMDKAIAHTILCGAGVAKTQLISAKISELSDTPQLIKKLEVLGYPMFIKPANAGSSVGVSKVKSSAELITALNAAFVHDNKIVAEKMIIGQEIECAVMGNDKPLAARVIGEIAPANEFYDYAGKYLDDSTAQYIPARICNKVAGKVCDIAVVAYSALECKGLARVDFFVTDTDEIILNEINTIPGFTSISMYPKLFAASGTSYSQLITKLIEYALEKIDG